MEKLVLKYLARASLYRPMKEVNGYIDLVTEAYHQGKSNYEIKLMTYEFFEIIPHWTLSRNIDNMVEAMKRKIKDEIH